MGRNGIQVRIGMQPEVAPFSGGPIVPTQPWSDLEEGIARANDPTFDSVHVDP